VPPNLAVISQKREMSDPLLQQEVLDALRSFNPEQVYLSRFDYGADVQSYLDANYKAVYVSSTDENLFIRTDIFLPDGRKK